MAGETEIVLCNPDNSINVEVSHDEETVCLNRQQMFIFFDRNIKTICKHISNALKEDLSVMATVANFGRKEKCVI